MTLSLRAVEHETWSRHAGEYDALFAAISRQVIEPLLDSLGDLASRRHLDVACGTGHLVAAAAARGSLSEGLDFAAPMIEVARRTYPYARFRVGDAAALPHEHGALDAVTCAFGLSHMERPQAAVDEAFRVLRPGGRLAFTLWFGPQDGNEFQRLVQEVVTAHVVTPVALPESWTRLRFADPARCAELTLQAGFASPAFQSIPVTWPADSGQAALNLFETLSVRTRAVLERQPPEIQRRVRDDLIAAFESCRRNGRIALAGPALLTVAQKPREEASR